MDDIERFEMARDKLTTKNSTTTSNYKKERFPGRLAGTTDKTLEN